MKLSEELDHDGNLTLVKKLLEVKGVPLYVIEAAVNYVKSSATLFAMLIVWEDSKEKEKVEAGDCSL